MYNFTIDEIMDRNAVYLFNKRKDIERHISNSYDIWEEALGSGNMKLNKAIASELFENKCKINVWNAIERPYSNDTIVFCNDIVSDNGKIAMMCREGFDRHSSMESFHAFLLEAAAKCFLTTQSSQMFCYNGYEDVTVKIADDFKYMLSIGGVMFKMELISPDVIWAYISHKLDMSKGLESAEHFDRNHPQEHKFNMLRSSFKEGIIGI